MENTILQSSASFLLPPSGRKLAPFLSACAKAIMGKSDADLARAMGVSPALIANWKRRGAVPNEHREWFRLELPRLVLDSNAYLRAHSSRAVHAATIVLLTAERRFDCLVPPDAELWAGLLPGLIALSELLTHARDPYLQEDFTASGLRTADEVSAVLAAIYPHRFKAREPSPQ